MEVFKVSLMFAFLLSLTAATPMFKLFEERKNEKRSAVNEKLKETLENIAKDPDKEAGEKIPAIDEYAGLKFREGDMQYVNLPPDPLMKASMEISGKTLESGPEERAFRPVKNSEMRSSEDMHLRSKRSALRDVRGLWRTRKVPYVLDDSLHAAAKEKIKAAIEEINSISCVKWFQSDGSQYHVKFRNLTGCWSVVGKAFKPNEPTSYQNISIGENCAGKTTIQHEMFHAMGFFHEQSRPDRNGYLVVHLDNVLSGMEHNFDKQSEAATDTRGFPYDFSSIMQYGNKAFSSDSQSHTMDDIRDPNKVFGDAKQLSGSDIAELNKVYDCTNTGNGWSNWGTWGPCINNKHVRWRFCFSEITTEACPGADSTYGSQWKTGSCSVQKVDGGWSQWYDWTHCTKSCATGTRTRYRSCTNPPPSGGGSVCAGSNSYSEDCNAGIPCSPAIKLCSFDLPCVWYVFPNNNNYKWITKTASSPSIDPAGPEGQYLYLSSESCNAGQRSDVFLQNGYYTALTAKPACIVFRYMHGAGMQTLYLGVFAADASSGVAIWQSAGIQGSIWHEIKATVPSNAPSPYRILFIAQCNTPGNSAIAIDEIELRSGICT